MKKISLIALFSISVFGQFTSTGAFKIGYFSPKSADGGMLLGYEGQYFVDDLFSFGYSIDWYRDTYVDKDFVNQLNISDPFGGQVNELRAKTSINSFPIMANISARLHINQKVFYYFSGGIGFETMFISYTNYNNPTNNDDKVLAALNYSINGGFGFYAGRRSEIFGEIGYHSSTPTWEYETTINNTKRTFERELFMSGIFLRAGFRFYY